MDIYTYTNMDIYTYTNMVSLFKGALHVNQTDNYQTCK